MRRLRRVLAGLALSLGAAGAALAEPVRVDGVTSGSGWLFGSPSDTRCWVVTAAHIADELRRPARFTWTRTDGSTGDVDFTWTAPEEDVAFGRVDTLPPGACPSRLGPPDLSVLVARNPEARLLQVLQTNLRTLSVRAGSYDGRIVRFDAAGPNGAARVQQGVSGGPIVIDRDNGDVTPFAMAIKDLPGIPGAFYAVRFDRLRAHFAQAEAGAASTAQALGGGTPGEHGTPYSVLRIEGATRAAGFGPGALIGDERCWSGAPADGARAARVEIETDHRGIDRVTVDLAPDCGPPPDGLILETPQGAAWRAASWCTITEHQASCDFAGSAHPRLRMVVIDRNGDGFGLSNLKVYTD